MSGNVTYLEDPEKSKYDKKVYRNLRLANGMSCLLISDLSPKTAKVKKVRSNLSHDVAEDNIGSSDSDSEKEFEMKKDSKIKKSPAKKTNFTEKDSNISDGEMAACCVAVDVGSFSEPPEYQGLAHFLEHMIHMGSEKYPEENAYDAHLHKCNGFCNAATKDEQTQYFFGVPNEYLDITMDYLAAALKSPILNKESMNQEILAIEHEFEEAAPDYEVRRDQILADLSSRNFPHAKFTWGNLKSLQQDVDADDLIKALLDFHNRHYSAHRMYLCVQAYLTLNEIENLVVKNFSDIPTNNLPGISFQNYPYNDAFLKIIYENIIFIKTEETESYLEIMWVLPPTIQYYKSKPADFIAYFIGYMGRGSLTSYLRQKYWIVNLDCGVDGDSSFDCNSMFSLFKINILLTKDGFYNLLEVISTIMAYIKLLPKAEALITTFNEIKFLTETHFIFEPEIPAYANVQYLSDNMKYYAPQHVLNGGQLLFEFDPYLVQTVIDNLKYAKYNLIISSNHAVTDNEKVISLVEKWFGTEYFAKPIPELWRTVLSTPSFLPELSLPPPNQFICKDFRIFWIESGRPDLPKFIQKIFQADVAELWFKQDDKYLLPEVYMCFKFFSPLPRQSPKNTVLLAMYARLINYYLEEQLFESQFSGLYGKFYASDRDLKLKIKGYNEKMLQLCDLIIKAMIDIRYNISEKQFEICRENETAAIHYIMTKPKALNNDVRLSIIENMHWTLVERYAAAQILNFKDMIDFCGLFTNELYIRGLIQGNLTEEIAHCVITNMLKAINCSPIQDIVYIENRACQIPLGNKYIRCRMKNMPNTISVICNYYQIGPTSLYLEILLDLVILLISEPMFNTLRTKERLGYSVWTNVRINYGILGYTLSVVSFENLNSATYVENRIEAFHNRIKDILKDISQEDFQTVISSQIKSRKLTNKALIADFIINWYIINSSDFKIDTKDNKKSTSDREENEDLLFDREEREVKILKELTKQELLDFWIQNEVANYRKLSVQVVGIKDSKEEINSGPYTTLEILTNEEGEKQNIINSLSIFKKDLYIFPVTKTKT